MNRKPKAALYMRVSTSDQTCEHQRRELLAYAKRAGWEPVEFKDKISGKTSSRKGLDAMRKGVRAGTFKVVACAKLDRLGRSVVHLVTLIGELARHGCALVVPGQGLDTSDNNPVGKLQIHVLAAVAEFERSLIGERVKAALATARANGKVLGRPSLMEERKALAEAVLARKPNLSVRELARELGCGKGTAERLMAALAA